MLSLSLLRLQLASGLEVEPFYQNQVGLDPRDCLIKTTPDKGVFNWLHQGSSASYLPSDSVLAAAQQASTKAILLTKSAML